MLRKIDQLRREPKHVRDRYAFYGATSATAVIAIIWVASVPAKFEPVAVTATDDQSGSISRAWQDVTSEFRGLREVFQAAATDDIESGVEDVAESISEPSIDLDIDAMFPEGTVPALPEQKTEGVTQRVLIGTTSTATNE